MNVHVGGQVIRTTTEHPFYVRGRGWVAARELRVGDLLCSHDCQWLPVEDLLDTGEYETVYNLRVADYHTYFVGAPAWGFSVWAHNAKYGFRVMSTEELKGAVKGKWADSLLVKNDPDEMGRKWLWVTKKAAMKWQEFIRGSGENPVVTKVPTAKDISKYPTFPHPPQGEAVHVPIPDLGKAKPIG